MIPLPPSFRFCHTPSPASRSFVPVGRSTCGPRLRGVAPGGGGEQRGETRTGGRKSGNAPRAHYVAPIHAPSPRQVPAKTRCAVPIRGYQGGRPPLPPFRPPRAFPPSHAPPRKEDLTGRPISVPRFLSPVGPSSRRFQLAKLPLDTPSVAVIN